MSILNRSRYVAGVSRPPVAFWIPNWTTAELEQLDPVRDWRLLMNSGDDWITQTYLHLRDAGYPVVAVHSPPAVP